MPASEHSCARRPQAADTFHREGAAPGRGENVGAGDGGSEGDGVGVGVDGGVGSSASASANASSNSSPNSTGPTAVVAARGSPLMKHKRFWWVLPSLRDVSNCLAAGIGSDPAAVISTASL